MAHTFEVFSADCPLCKDVIMDIERGKCPDCIETVYNVNTKTPEIEQKMKKYGIQAVPTTIIDRKYRVVGVPDFTWKCGTEMDKKLETEYQVSKL